MFKKSLMLFTAFVTLWSVQSICQAEILPPHGPGQIGYSSVVLCENLGAHKEPSADSEVTETLHGGDRVMVMEQKDGWAHIAVSDDVDAVPPGWVNAEYVVIDPSWYKADEKTVVYAWNDTAALKVAELSKDTVLPILKDTGEWLVVGLRGGTGWIHTDRAPADTKSDEQSKKSSDSEGWFTVYAEDGSSVKIHPTEGAMFEDEKGRTYSNVRGDIYYCITTDVTYAADPAIWVNGEPKPDDTDEYGLTGEDYGETHEYQDDDDDDDDDDVNDGVDEYGLTGEDYGETHEYQDGNVDEYGLTGEDYGETHEYQD